MAIRGMKVAANDEKNSTIGLERGTFAVGPARFRRGGASRQAFRAEAEGSALASRVLPSVTRSRRSNARSAFTPVPPEGRDVVLSGGRRLAWRHMCGRASSRRDSGFSRVREVGERLGRAGQRDGPCSAKHTDPESAKFWRAGKGLRRVRIERRRDTRFDRGWTFGSRHPHGGASERTRMHRSCAHPPGCGCDARGSSRGGGGRWHKTG